MSESIGEMLIPATYIEVRAEGLIGVGGISTGTIGVIGTANRGPLNTVRALGTYSDALNLFGTYDAWPEDPTTDAHLTLTRTLEQVFRGGASDVLAVRVANVAPGTMASTTWTLTEGGDVLSTLTAQTPGSWANDIEAALVVPAQVSDPLTLTLTLGADRETYEGMTITDLVDEINDASNFVTASDPAQADEARRPDTVAQSATLGGPDGAGAMNALIPQINEGLALLADRTVNLLVIAGYNADVIRGAVLGHLESTETNGLERIAVMGVSGDDLQTVATDASNVSNRRAVLVAPGIEAVDASTGGTERLPAAYAAALVAGRLSTLAPHISLTNKDVAVDGLTTYYSRAQQKQLLQNRIMALHRNLGIRALRGITTDTGPFQQISVRRIVDFAKAGVRIGSNPYIGRLNNSRVRAALKATLDGFLSQMVVDEMLVSYELDVSATRAQEIAGIAAVTMTLRPTFSIDFIRVTMNLE
ncbi:MAG: phage tail sheath C-terminal domain-containing protein [Pseudomonadota bacterium]